MNQAYTPGLLVTECTTIEKIRELPLPGKVLVTVGDKVSATAPVLSADLPGELDIIRVADLMDIDPSEAVKGIKIRDGDLVKTGDLICATKIFFGLFDVKLKSPTSGTVEFFTPTNAHLGIRHPSTPITVNAYIDGIVTDVATSKSATIRSTGALIQGIFGVGGEKLGSLYPLNVSESAEVLASDIDNVGDELRDAILIGGACFSKEALQSAATRKIAGVITGSLDASTLCEFVGHDISVSITGDEDVPFTLIITEGFGHLPLQKRISKLAHKLAGKRASINGATQVRAGAMRPEVIVPSEDCHDTSLLGTHFKTPSSQTKGLTIGSDIRIIRVPYFGKLARVTELPTSPQTIPTGATVRVLKATLTNGDEVVVPRANVELISVAN